MRTKNIAMILTMALTAGLCQTAAPSQAATPKLSAKKLTIDVYKRQMQCRCYHWKKN